MRNVECMRRGTYVLLLDLGLYRGRQVRTMALRGAVGERTSSSGVKSFTMLNSLRISSGVFPLIMLATVLQPTSLQGEMIRVNIFPYK